MELFAVDCKIKVWIGKVGVEYTVTMRSQGEFAVDLQIPQDATKIQLVKKGSKHIIVNWRGLVMPQLREVRASPSILFVEPEAMLATVTKATISLLSNYFELPTNVVEGKISTFSTMYGGRCSAGALSSGKHAIIEEPISSIFYRDWKPPVRYEKEIAVRTEDTIKRFPYKSYRAEDIIPADAKVVTVWTNTKDDATIDFAGYSGAMRHYRSDVACVNVDLSMPNLKRISATIVVQGWLVVPEVSLEGSIKFTGTGCVDASRLASQYSTGANLLYCKHPLNTLIPGTGEIGAMVSERDGVIYYAGKTYANSAQFEADYPELAEQIGHPPRAKSANK